MINKILNNINYFFYINSLKYIQNNIKKKYIKNKIKVLIKNINKENEKNKLINKINNMNSKIPELGIVKENILSAQKYFNLDNYAASLRYSEQAKIELENIIKNNLNDEYLEELLLSIKCQIFMTKEKNKATNEIKQLS